MNFSVIIPSFNRRELLPRALNSVLAQTYLAAEIIVVDDGSTDDTALMVARDFPQVRLFVQANQGVSAARNLGLRHAQNEWVALLDSDDEWLPHKLAEQVAALEASGLLISHTHEFWIRNGKPLKQQTKHQKFGGNIYKQCLPLCAMSPSSIVIHQNVFQAVGNFDESLPACEDYDLWLRIAARYEVNYIARECINKYGGHDDQLSRQHWGMDRFRVLALEKMLALDSDSPQLDHEQREATLNMLIKKLRILQQGASKHNNVALQNYCALALRRWTHA